MSFAGVSFFSISGVSRSANTIPVFSTSALEAATAAGTSTLTPALTWSQVKVRRDTGDQVLHLPIAVNDIATFETCNVAVINFTQYNRWYWITGYTEVTNSAYPTGSIDVISYQVQLEYIPVTTSISLTQSTVDILPERKPTATARMMQNWTESIMLPATPTTALPLLPKIGTVKKALTGPGTINVSMLWCEVTITDSNKIKRFGMFIGTSAEGYSSHIFAYNRNSLGNGYDVYPSLQEIMDDPLTYLGQTGTVTDVNISEFCPYQIVKNNTEDADEEYVHLKAGGVSINPPELYTYAAYHYRAYNLTNNLLPKSSGLDITKGTFTVSLTDFEGMNGQLIVKDSMRNDVVTIPRETNDNSMLFNYFVYSDNNNIYLVLEYMGVQYTIPGYKIPWTTSMWDNYRSYSLQFDRQALQNNIDTANREMTIALTDAAANGIIGGSLAGAMTGGPAGAGLGLFAGVSSFASSAISGNIKREETIRKLSREQDLTEQRMKAGPATMNNIGLGYAILYAVYEYGGASLVFKMPADFTSTQWGYQTDTWGYPSNKVLISGKLSEGYWKGRIMKALTNFMNNTDKGEAFDRLVEQVDGGIRLKKVL